MGEHGGVEAMCRWSWETPVEGVGPSPITYHKRVCSGVSVINRMPHDHIDNMRLPTLRGVPKRVMLGVS